MKTTIFFTWLAGIIILCSCHNDRSSQTALVGFYLTDAPAVESFKEVNVDVQSVQYSLSGENWVKLPVNPGVIDLLKFNNGKDTLLSNIVLDAGVRIQQVRLILGNNNSLMLEDGTVVNLGTPSGQTSGLKINVQSDVEVTSGYKVVIDFDAARSIVRKGNGTYSLKPVIRAYIEANTSSVSGYLLPSNQLMRVFTVTTAGDTIATLSDTTANNYFLLHGLFSGTYDIQAGNPAGTEILSLKENLNVVGGTDVNLGTITLPAR